MSEEAQRTLTQVQQDIRLSRFLALASGNQHKENCWTLLWIYKYLQNTLQTIVSKGFIASALSLSRVTGLFISVGRAMGPIVQLWTQGLYREIMQAESWECSPSRKKDNAKSDSRRRILRTLAILYGPPVLKWRC